MAQAMRIAVVGVGGVGGYFGGRLAQSGADVTFIARGATLEALRTKGLRVASINGDFSIDRVHATDSPAGPFDAVLMATKAWQLRDAAEQICPALHDDSLVVPLQNGIDAPEQLAAVLGTGRVGGGLCAIVALAVAPGVIKHTGAEPMIMLGELDNRRSDRAERLCDFLRAASIRAEIPPDIHRSMWTKFVFIAPLSAVGAVARVPIGTWRSVPETRELVERGVAEVVAVATARGVALDADVIARTMQRYDGLPPGSTPSLQRDVMDGKPSELEAQIGAVVRLGRQTGIPTPVHDTIYRALLPSERVARGQVM